MPRARAFPAQPPQRHALAHETFFQLAYRLLEDQLLEEDAITPIQISLGSRLQAGTEA